MNVCVPLFKHKHIIKPIWSGYVPFHSVGGCRRPIPPSRWCRQSFPKFSLCKISKRSCANFCHGRENPFSTIHIFQTDFEMNRPQIAGLESGRSTDCASRPRLPRQNIPLLFFAKFSILLSFTLDWHSKPRYFKITDFFIIFVEMSQFKHV